MNNVESERYLTPYIVLFLISNKTYNIFSAKNNRDDIFYLPPLSAIPTQNKLFPNKTKKKNTHKKKGKRVNQISKSKGGDPGTCGDGFRPLVG